LEMELLWNTILLRPYVFFFLAIFFLGGSLQFGPRATLAFLPLGYLIAFLSELSSIRCGFPYGDYYYIGSTLGREIWVLGVPLMDSLSYVFLAACSYGTAIFLLSPMRKEAELGVRWKDLTNKNGLAHLTLATVLMVVLDIVIDPVALQGDKWFLGQIYGYKTYGAYFGIPLSNFAGWLLVGLILVWTLRWTICRFGRGTATLQWNGLSLATLWGPSLYVMVLLFNLTVTFAIGDVALGVASSLVTATVLGMGAAVGLHNFRHGRRAAVQEEVEPQWEKAVD
jgi:uncharacterized membrane protein